MVDENQPLPDCGDALAALEAQSKLRPEIAATLFVDLSHHGVAMVRFDMDGYLQLVRREAWRAYEELVERHG